MPQLDETGRRLGKCRVVSNEESLEKLGKGMNMRRNSGGGPREGKRPKSELK